MKAKLIYNNKEYEVEVSEKQIKQIINETNQTRFRAKNYMNYYFLDDAGNIHSTSDCYCSFDNYRFDIGNYFESADNIEGLKIKLIYKQRYKDFLGEDLVTENDWKNFKIAKFYASYNYQAKIINLHESYEQKIQGTIYSKSKEKINEFVSLIGDDYFKKYVLEINE